MQNSLTNNISKTTVLCDISQSLKTYLATSLLKPPTGITVTCGKGLCDVTTALDLPVVGDAAGRCRHVRWICKQLYVCVNVFFFFFVCPFFSFFSRPQKMKPCTLHSANNRDNSNDKCTCEILSLSFLHVSLLLEQIGEKCDIRIQIHYVIVHPLLLHYFAALKHSFYVPIHLRYNYACRYFHCVLNSHVD